MSIQPSTSGRLAYAAISGGLILPIIAHAYVGTFSRFAADSYTHAALVARHGLMGMIAHLYRAWSGRYSASFVEGLASGLAGPRFSPVWPGIALAAWWLALAFAVKPLAPRRWPAIILPSIILFATVASMRSASQALYWSTGMFNYLPPLILLCVWLGLVARGWLRSWWGIGASLALTLVAGGFNETYGVLQAALMLLMLLAWRWLPKAQRGAVAAGAAGAIVALALVGLAPGNQVRQSLHAHTAQPAALLTLSVLHAGFIALAGVIRAPLALAGAMAIPAWLRLMAGQAKPQAHRQSLRRALVLTPLLTFALLVVATAPAIYATSAPPNTRTLTTHQFILTAGLAVFGLLAGEWLRRRGRDAWRWPLATLALLAALNGVWGSVQTFRTAPGYAACAAEWDRTYSAELAANHLIVQVPEPECLLAYYQTQ